jgi:ribosomal protein S18 acetylase RimI-like enzyme
VDARTAIPGELADSARLLCRFNAEYDDPVPETGWLTQRLAQLVSEEGALILVAGTGPDGVAVARFRPTLWAEGPECYLAELYVVPEHRGQGLGRALLDGVLVDARRRHCTRVELGTSEADAVAVALYERFGFTRLERPGGPVMWVYELEL